jgi:lysozyme
MGDNCTEEQAFNWLEYEVNKKVQGLDKVLAGIKLNENQCSAIISLTYNIGLKGFSDSVACKLIKANPLDPNIKDAWLSWNKVTVNGKKEVNKGLMNRRKREYQLYCT